MDKHPHNAKELEACRQRTEATHQTADRGGLEMSSVDLPIVSFFDWEPVELTTPHLITFRARVRFAFVSRSFRVRIDVTKLASDGRTADLERLHNILAARHAGLDDGRSLLGALEWLLNLSTEQTEPELSPGERRLKVRTLLFAT
jgi:hypothetical protein